MLPCRQTQWDPPSWDGVGEEPNVEHEAEMDLGTPTYDENPSKVLIKSFSLSTLTKSYVLNNVFLKDCKLFWRPVQGLRFAWSLW